MTSIERRALLKMAGGAWLASGTAFADALHDARRDSISINWSFEGGNLARADRLDDATFRCHVNGQVDQDGRNRQASWYSFRIDGAGGRAVTFTMVGSERRIQLHPQRRRHHRRYAAFLQLRWNSVAACQQGQVRRLSARNDVHNRNTL